MFVRYRTKWAWGFSPWAWIEMSDRSTPDDLADWAETINNDNGWSDKYRGCEYEPGLPPVEHIISCRDNAKAKIVELTEMISYYDSMISDMVSEETLCLPSSVE